MHLRFLTAGFLASAIAIAPAEQAQADAGDFIGGAIVGGLVTGAIMHNNQKAKQQTTRSNQNTRSNQKVYRQGIPSTQQGRETQTALNYFGYNAGRVDGQVGRGTRAAIERYQVSMGYPVNGRDFPSYQYTNLMDAYYWAINGGAAQTRLVGQPLLLAYRDLRTAPQSQLALAPQGHVTRPEQQPVTNGYVVAGAPAVVPQATVPDPQTSATDEKAAALTQDGTGAVPNLFAGGAMTESLANRCNSVMLQTSTNGGYTTLATLSDPAFTLEEQFCVARSYAISQGERQMQSITGLTQDQISQQCGQLAGSIAQQIDAVSLMSQAEAEQAMRSFALGTGIPPADLAATSKVCLAVGYRQDDMRMAVGSALLLSAMGDKAYGELLGHHLLEGFGTASRADLALQWYNASLTALENGAVPAFMPGQPERTALVRAATVQLSQGAVSTPTPVSDATSQSQPLPTFEISQ